MAAPAPAALAVDVLSPAAPVMPAAPELGFEARAVTAGLAALSAPPPAAGAAVCCPEDELLDMVGAVDADPAAALLLAAGEVAVFTGSIAAPGDLDSLEQAVATANSNKTYVSDIGRMNGTYWSRTAPFKARMR